MNAYDKEANNTTTQKSELTKQVEPNNRKQPNKKQKINNNRIKNNLWLNLVLRSHVEQFKNKLFKQQNN